MKMRHNYYIQCVLLVSLLLLSGKINFSQVGNLDIFFDLQENQLLERLTLSNEDTETVKSIFNMLRSQEEQDRQNFKESALGLIGAAVRRAQMAETVLFNRLSPVLQSNLLDIKASQKQFREFFYLKEGLCLTPEQSMKVKALLAMFSMKKPDALMNEAEADSLMGSRYNQMNDALPGMYPGMQPNQVNPNMPNNIHGNMMGDYTGFRSTGLKEDLYDWIRDQEKEKEKSIESMLTPEQKKLFSQLKVERNKELEIKIDEMKKNRN